MTCATCARCTRPVPDTTYVCADCTSHVADQLAAVPGLVDELPAAHLRQTRFGTGGGLGGWSEPWDERATLVERETTEVMARWARHIIDRRQLLAIPQNVLNRVPLGPLCYAAGGRLRHCTHDSCQAITSQYTQAGAAALLISRHLTWLRYRREASGAMTELLDTITELRRAVDRPGDLWWAGPCNALVDDEDGDDQGGEERECGADLFGRPDAATIRCRSCGARHDAAGRRTWMLAEAREVFLHAEAAARVLTVLGVKVTSSQVRNLAARGRLHAPNDLNARTPLGPTCRTCVHASCQAISRRYGRREYRLGDIIDLLDQHQQAQAERAARRAATEATKTRDEAA